MQWPSRRWTRSHIHGGGSWESTASRRAMFRTGWITTLVVADPGADLGEGGGAELPDLTDGEGVGFEIAGVDPHVRLDLRVIGCLGVGR